MLPVTLILLIVFIAAGLPVAAVLGNLGLVLDWIYSPMPLSKAIGMVSWSTATEYTLVAIPLFILLGEILLRSGVAQGMYNAMRHWLSWLPGGLMHSNIGACSLFAATSGSSVATAATIGTVAVPEIGKHGYNEPLFLGSLAAGGTLGILIPPSINMIIYGVLTDTSIPKLYLAAVIPGAIMAVIFILTILIACVIRPQWGGRPTPTSWEGRLGTLKDLLPPLGIFLVVIGSIYAGLATPTESAAMGVVAAFGLAAWRRRLTLPMVRQCFEGTIRTSSMIALIILAAYFLNFVISAVGLTNQINTFITTLGLSKYGTIAAVIVFYVVIGCFMETLSMMITTVTIITPVVVSAGFDPIWFGVMMMLLVEMSQITPPIGINLYVIQSIRRGGPIDDVILGVVPFCLALAVMIVLLVLVPDLAMWLPDNV
jgi:tripartite ATP-independent transporter DctM subunit